MKSKIKIVINNKELSVEDNVISSNLLFTEDEIKNLSTDLEQAAAQLRTMANKHKKKQWRQKPAVGEEYYSISCCGYVIKYKWYDNNADYNCFRAGNCFPCRLFTKEQVQQIVWQNQLSGLLAQYAIVNGALASKEEKEDDAIPLYWAEEECDGDFTVDPLYSQNPLVVKFNKYGVAQQALEDVIKPFLAEHPDFVW